jgi:N-acetylglucosaminyldiphosphoundecaprenol N-acetyl-beta-D-mannosaminyltransferase
MLEFGSCATRCGQTRLPGVAWAAAGADSRPTVLGVAISDVTMPDAVEIVGAMLRRHDECSRCVYFVNAHSLNIAASDPAYRNVLNLGDNVFGDGTGVRWAARLRGVRLRDNLNGTDFVPSLLRTTGGCGHSCFLLGGDASTIELAADFARRTFTGWRLSGWHHGYLADDASDAAVVARINEAKPDLLLVGMGNPLQEKWIHRHLPALCVSVCMGVGGLFDFWAGNVSRSPRWLRRLGHEWLWRLLQEPRRMARRYLVGNPLFLARVLSERSQNR